MSWITVVWSMAAGACLTLGAVHLLVWFWDRASQANIWFAGAALSIAGFAAIEWSLMRVQTPAEFLALHRWGHFLIFWTITAIIGFVQSYFRTGRPWLAWTVIALRALVVVLAFVPGPTFNYREVTALVPFALFGETVAAPVAVPSPWARLGEASLLLMVVFVVDAAIRLWRKGDARERQRALVVGGGVVLCILACTTNALLVHTGTVPSPYFISLAFMFIVAAMGSELSRDMMGAARMTEELRENAESMSLAADAAHLALWRWDIPRDVIWTSTPGRGLYGVPEHEPVDFQRFLSTLHPEDREPVRQAVDKALAGDGKFRASYRVVPPDGSIRWIDATGKVEFAEGRPRRMLGVSADVTAQKQAADRFQLAVEASPNGILLVDPEGRIVLANACAERLFGYPRAELTGLPVDQLVPEQCRRGHAGLRQSFHADPRSRSMGAGRELFARRKDGREFPVEIGISPLQSAEGTLILTSIVDISARKEAEAEARRHREELAHLSRVALLGEMAGTLAHELNQPLTGIVNNASAGRRFIAKGRGDLPRLDDLFEAVAADARRAGDIIRSIRDMVRKGEPERVPVNLNEVLAATLRLVHTETVGRHCEIVIETDATLPPVAGDAVQLQQVLLNLIVNAFDAMRSTPEAGRRLILRTARVSASSVSFSVRDFGTGLPEEAPERVFEQFYSTKREGLGLGLAIARSIITSHGGVLDGANAGGGGACFSFVLPVWEEAAA